MGRSERALVRRWRELGWEGWWGDHVDARFELIRQARAQPRGRMLDVGCGHGIVLGQVRHDSMRVGIDRTADVLRVVRALAPGAHVVCADMEHLPFRDGVFDVVLLGGVMEYAKDMCGFIGGVSRSLRRGGRVLATTANRGHWQYRHGTHWLTADEVAAAFAVFGQAVVSGYNPLPSIDRLLPDAIVRRIPPTWTKFFFVPSKILGWMPGMTVLFRYLMRFDRLRTHAKAVFVSAIK